MDIEKRIKIIKALNSDYEIQKEAGLFTAITSVIGASFSDVFNPDDISGSLMKIATTAVMGYFFGIWWSLATAVLQYGFGIDIKVILQTINSVLSSFISTVFNSGTQNQVNTDKASEELTDEVMIASNITGPQLEEPIGNMITAAQKDMLVKEAGIGGLAKLFGGSLKGFMTVSSGGFIRKVIGTIIKGLLAGAGIGVGASALMRGVSPSSNSSSETIGLPEISFNRNDSREVGTKKQRDTRKANKTLRHYVGRSSGAGETPHINDANDKDEGSEAWYMPNNSGDFGRTLWNWVFDIYPDMNNSAEDILYGNFVNVYDSIKPDFYKYNDRSVLNTSGSVVRIPKTIKGKRVQTVKNIVDIILDSIRV